MKNTGVQKPQISHHWIERKLDEKSFMGFFNLF